MYVVYEKRGYSQSLRCHKNVNIFPYRSKISRELSCLSSGLPSAFLRSLFNSSTARIYSVWSSPAGYVTVMYFESGFTKSTSDDFFNGTEINVAISARQLLNQKKMTDTKNWATNTNSSLRTTSWFLTGNYDYVIHDGAETCAELVSLQCGGLQVIYIVIFQVRHLFISVHFTVKTFWNYVCLFQNSEGNCKNSEIKVKIVMKKVRMGLKSEFWKKVKSLKLC